MAGFERFHARHFDTEPQRMADLVLHGQHPEILVIACCDSRCDPAILTAAEPGDLFVMRNVGGFVPAHDPDRQPQATSAAIEFAVRGLGVTHIVVLGHGQCGGVRWLIEGSNEVAFEFLGPWVETMRDAVASFEETDRASGDACRFTEQAAILLSLGNLLGFPWIGERLERGDLALHGWYFDLEPGLLMVYEPASNRFVPSDGQSRPLERGAHAPDLDAFALSARRRQISDGNR